MENNKVTKEKFLEQLMFKFYTEGNMVSDEEDAQVRLKFRLQMNWTKNRSVLPKRIKDML